MAPCVEIRMLSQVMQSTHMEMSESIYFCVQTSSSCPLRFMTPGLGPTTPQPPCDFPGPPLLRLLVISLEMQDGLVPGVRATGFTGMDEMLLFQSLPNID